MNATRARTIALTLLCAALLALALSSSAATAASVINGNFESGDLTGWHVQHQIDAGNWFAYSGTREPLENQRRESEPVQAPPQGRYAAIADENARDSLILYQDIALVPGADQTLSLLAYYDSRKPYFGAPAAPFAIPTPDTLSAAFEDLGGQANQQFRIDVINPSAPLDSLDPADILRTIFQAKAGDPTRKFPTRFSADLGAFAGQTVRLRVVAVATEAILNAGVDDVSISGPGGLGSNGGAGKKGGGRLRIARLKTNRRNGTAILFVRVPGPGLVTATTSARTIQSTTVKAHAAGVVRLRLRPTRRGRAILRRKRKLRAPMSVVYTPANGARQVAHARVALKLSRHLTSH